MHVLDIQAALTDREVEAIENAFRALVGYPRDEEIEGAHPSALADMLLSVCDSLDHDENGLPDETAELIGDVTGSPATTYAAAAKIVRDNLPAWRARFAS